jgi:hypothetical protein
MTTDTDVNEGSSASADTTTASPDATNTAPVNEGTQASPDTSSSGDTSASSPDAPVDDRAGLLAAVKKVIEAKPDNPGGEGDKAAPDGSSPATDPKTTATTAADPLNADPTDAELAGMVPKTKARVEKLLSERNAARTEIDSLKPHAAKWQKMDGYLRKNDLAAEDVNLLLGVGAAMRRGDWKAVHDGMAPYFELSRQHLGLSLPADLQTKVDAGELTGDAAKELSTTRLTNVRLAATVKANGDAATAATQREATNRMVTAVQGAATQWEADAKARDPDYAKKAPTVLRISQAIMAEHGRPTTAAAAIEIANRALEETNRIFAAAKPAPVATKQNPVGAGAVTGGKSEPKSLMEAALMGLERARA